MADSTFNDWVVKYKKDKSLFINGKHNDSSIDLKPAVKPTFIEIFKDKVITPIQNTSSSIKLNYKDVSLEFSVNELEKVMDIIRRWQTSQIRASFYTLMPLILEKALIHYHH